MPLRYIVFPINIKISNYYYIHFNSCLSGTIPTDLLDWFEVIDDDQGAGRVLLVHRGHPLDRLHQADRGHVPGVVGLLRQQLRGALVHKLVAHSGVD